MKTEEPEALTGVELKAKRDALKRLETDGHWAEWWQRRLAGRIIKRRNKADWAAAEYHQIKYARMCAQTAHKAMAAKRTMRRRMRRASQRAQRA